MFERKVQRDGLLTWGTVALLALGFVCSPCLAVVYQAMPCCPHHDGGALACGGGRIAPLDLSAQAAPDASALPMAPTVRAAVSAWPAGPSDLDVTPPAGGWSGAELVLLHQTLLR